MSLDITKLTISRRLECSLYLPQDPQLLIWQSKPDQIKETVDKSEHDHTLSSRRSVLAPVKSKNTV